MKIKVALLSVALVLAATIARSAERKVEIFDNEVIVLYGDSITEQNLYSAYVETYLITRLIDRNIRVYNFGWSGDTAAGGNMRFERDVMGVEPSLVFVNFGMNDGGYGGINQKIYDWYINSQTALAETIKAAGAQEVFLTTSPVHPFSRTYNDMLGKMADGVLGLAERRGLPSADIFHPMLKNLEEIAAAHPKRTLIPDGVHPAPTGQLLMAYYILREVDAPRVVGDIVLAGGEVVKAEASKIEDLKSEGGVVSFKLTLPFIPFYVDPGAREALSYIPFQKELNRFTLAVSDWNSDRSCLVTVDGAEAGTVTAKEIAEGADFALLDSAPWTKQGQEVLGRARFRWQKHYDAWRTMDVAAKDYVKAPSTHGLLLDIQKKYVEELGNSLQEIARPRTYDVTLSVASSIDFSTVSLSPLYEFEESMFDKAFPPETTPDEVAWTKADLDKSGFLNLLNPFPDAGNCIVYIRLLLDAEEACNAHLSFGSDDGIKVLLNGTKVFGKDVYRGYVAGEDNAQVKLKAGRNTLMFAVTQGGGGFGFGAKARVLGTTRVVVVDAE